MRRREFITLIGGSVASFVCAPARIRALSTDRMRRVGAIVGYAENDSATHTRISAFVEGLRELGWIEGRNIEIGLRFTGGDVNQIPALTKELIDRQPDAILANTTPVTAELARRTKSIPIVFVVVSDPVGSGFITSLARPGGNITGFVNVEGSMGSKWLELLKQVAPHTTRVAVLFNPDTAPYADYYLRPLEMAATSLVVKAIRAPARNGGEVEDVLAKLAREPGGGVIGISDSFLTVNRQEVAALALRYHLPTVFGTPESGALISYAPDTRDLFQRSASYVDRVLRGANPAELPVQVPTKFEMVIDLKVAKVLGLEVPEKLLALADEVIE
jgi:putative tryptophan/tyrosine transport system substrate-binding protein